MIEGVIEVIEDVKKVTEERHFYSKNHAKLTYFHLIFPSFQYYAALILLTKSEVSIVICHVTM